MTMPVKVQAADRPPWDVAIDLHSRNLFVLVADRSGKELWHRRIPNHQDSAEWLAAQLRSDDRVVIEATGGAHALADRLDGCGAQLVLVDPQETRLVGLRGKKTDYRDCRALLRHLRSGDLPKVWRPDRCTREIRHLTRERHAFNQTIVRMKNRIRALLREEGLNSPSGLWEGPGRAWLAAQLLPPAARRVLEREEGMLDVALAFKKQQEQELAERATMLPEAKKLMQLTGFGPAAAVMVLGEIGNAKRFGSSKSLVDYAGLCPRVNQSDQVRRHGPITKAGRSQLRWLMIEVGWAHVRHNGPEAQHYHRLVARGKTPQQAIVALARHLLVLVYCLLTREENYREQNPEQYLKKLIELGRKRPEGEDVRERPRDWAEQQFGEITGQAPPVQPSRQRPALGEQAETAAAEARTSEDGAAGEQLQQITEKPRAARPKRQRSAPASRESGVSAPTAPNSAERRGRRCGSAGTAPP